MSKFEYSLSDSDITAITFALQLLPSLRLEGDNEIQADINYQLCLSAGYKIIHREPNISPNEFRVIFCALQAIQLIKCSDIIPCFLNFFLKSFQIYNSFSLYYHSLLTLLSCTRYPT